MQRHRLLPKDPVFRWLRRIWQRPSFPNRRIPRCSGRYLVGTSQCDQCPGLDRLRRFEAGHLAHLHESDRRQRLVLHCGNRLWCHQVSLSSTRSHQSRTPFEVALGFGQRPLVAISQPRPLLASKGSGRVGCEGYCSGPWFRQVLDR